MVLSNNITDDQVSGLAVLVEKWSDFRVWVSKHRYSHKYSLMRKRRGYEEKAQAAYLP